MTKKTGDAATTDQIPERFATVPAFVAAEPWLQAAIVAAIDGATPDGDGLLTLYPSRIAYLDAARREDGSCGSCVEEIGRPGWAPIVHHVTPDQAAHLLAHVPPPFYLTEEAARVGNVLAQRPAP